MGKFEGLGDNTPEKTYDNPEGYYATTHISFNVIAAQLRGEDAKDFLAAKTDEERTEIVKAAIGDELYHETVQEIKDAGFAEGIRLKELEKLIKRSNVIEDVADYSPTDQALMLQGMKPGKDFVSDNALSASDGWAERANKGNGRGDDGFER